jgi:hypothetical protein
MLGVQRPPTPDKISGGSRQPYGNAQFTYFFPLLLLMAFPPRSSHQNYLAPYRQLHLRTLLIAPFILLSVSAVGLVGYFSYRSGQQAVEKLAYQLMDVTAMQVNDHLNEFLGEAQRLLNATQINLEKQVIDVADFVELEDYFVAQIQLYEQFTGLGFANAEGEVIGAGVDKHGFLVPTRSFLAGEATNEHPREYYLYSLDDQGNRTELIHTVSNYDPRELDWYQLALTQGQAWTPVYSMVVAPAAISLRVSPVSVDGQFQGILYINISLDDISDFLSQLQIAQQGQVFIIEPSGNLVAASTGEAIYQLEQTTQERSLIRLNALNSEHELTRATVQAVLNQRNVLGGSRNFNFEFIDATSLVDAGLFHSHEGPNMLRFQAISSR